MKIFIDLTRGCVLLQPGYGAALTGHIVRLQKLGSFHI